VIYSGGRGGGAPEDKTIVPAAKLRRAKRGFTKNLTGFLVNGTSAATQLRGMLGCH
jgi:hypothetical protein